jgi:hypothetical protein
VGRGRLRAARGREGRRAEPSAGPGPDQARDGRAFAGEKPALRQGHRQTGRCRTWRSEGRPEGRAFGRCGRDGRRARAGAARPQDHAQEGPGAPEPTESRPARKPRAKGSAKPSSAPEGS